MNTGDPRGHDFVRQNLRRPSIIKQIRKAKAKQKKEAEVLIVQPHLTPRLVGVQLVWVAELERLSECSRSELFPIFFVDRWPASKHTHLEHFDAHFHIAALDCDLG